MQDLPKNQNLVVTVPHSGGQSGLLDTRMVSLLLHGGTPKVDPTPTFPGLEKEDHI